MLKRLKAKFKDNRTALAAAVNEVLTARRYPAYMRGIYEAGETLYSWSVKRGALWA